MFELSDLEIPVVAAPMAGGPSTTALAIAVNHAGGLGFLAAGYADPGVLAGQIEEVRVAAGAPFGVNIFVPGLPVRDRVAVQEYRESLRPLADRYGIDLPDIVEVDDDGYRTKLDLVIEHRVPVVSFTFGLPSAEDVARLHDAGIFVVSTVADPDDADRAVALGVDALCVQGVEAGGHRGTLDLDAVPNTTPTVRLVREVVDRSDVPVIAAGGIGDGTAIIAALAAGASAVQLVRHCSTPTRRAPSRPIGRRCATRGSPKPLSPAASRGGTHRRCGIGSPIRTRRRLPPSIRRCTT